MAAVAVQKSAGREREKEEKEERKRKRRKKREEKKERKGEESKRERCIRPMGVKHPLEMSKGYKHDKRHEKGGLNLKKKNF